MAQQQDASRRPGSSTMQKHADEIRTLVAVFRDEPVSASSVEWLTTRLEGLADRMSPLAPTPVKPRRRRLRAVR